VVGRARAGPGWWAAAQTPWLTGKARFARLRLGLTGRQVGLDVDEFERFFALMRPRLMRSAMRSLDVETANEAALAALHTIWTKNVPTPRDSGEQLQLQALTFRVLDGHVRNAQRAQARRTRLLDALVEHQFVAEATEPDVVESIEYQEAELAIRALLEELPTKEREVVTLVIDGFKVGEIAAMLGRRPGAISMRLNRARKRLKEVLGREGT
jgi:RNA polymerase sigma-70 factor, ECF subfamily